MIKISLYDETSVTPMYICDGDGDEDSDVDDGGDEAAALGMHLGPWTNKFTKILFAGGLTLRTAPTWDGSARGPRAGRKPLTPRSLCDSETRNLVL